MLRESVRFLTVVFFTLTALIVLFSALNFANSVEFSAQHSVVKVENKQLETKRFTVRLSQASLFRHMLQKPLWVSFFIKVDFPLPQNKADANFYSEPIKYHWFEMVTISSYRVSQWKESNSQYRQLALAD